MKTVFGTDLGIFSYRTNEAREFGEMATNGIPPCQDAPGGDGHGCRSPAEGRHWRTYPGKIC
ncbi:MAG: hypothetical protein ABSB80_01385 [Methanoregula sp.]|uniref:hypothetical protein n=1 Tax=Methanoregula sp. TaxID=2052170 RepID=UPI003D0B18BA